MAGQRCAHPGCRAWAMRRERFCVAHRGVASGELGVGSRGTLVEAEVEQVSRFSAEVLAGNREGLLESGLLQLIAEAGANRAIDTELGALRVLLLRALAQESLTGDLAGTALTVARLTDAIGRALKVRQTLEGGRHTQLEHALYQVLSDLDLTGDEPPPDDLPDPHGFAAPFDPD